MKQNIGIGQLEKDKPTAAEALKKEAVAVKDAAAEHPHSISLILGIVATGAFLLGHMAGYRSAERDLSLSRTLRGRFR